MGSYEVLKDLVELQLQILSVNNKRKLIGYYPLFLQTSQLKAKIDVTFQKIGDHKKVVSNKIKES